MNMIKFFKQALRDKKINEDEIIVIDPEAEFKEYLQSPLTIALQKENVNVRLFTEILNGDISIYDLPLFTRLSNKNYYIAAFRYTRNISKKEYDKVFKLLKSDIKRLPRKKKQRFQKLYDTYNKNNKWIYIDEFHNKIMESEGNEVK